MVIILKNYGGTMKIFKYIISVALLLSGFLFLNIDLLVKEGIIKPSTVNSLISIFLFLLVSTILLWSSHIIKNLLKNKI